MNSFCIYPEQLKLLLVSLSFCKTLKACFLRHFKIIRNKLVTKDLHGKDKEMHFPQEDQYEIACFIYHILDILNTINS